MMMPPQHLGADGCAGACRSPTHTLISGKTHKLFDFTKFKCRFPEFEVTTDHKGVDLLHRGGRTQHSDVDQMSVYVIRCLKAAYPLSNPEAFIYSPLDLADSHFQLFRST